MSTPQKPPNENHRLRVLRGLGILDTEFEERFDRITRTATRLFQVPIALVSLVDENRQWFKSRQGLDTLETPREISFCGHAILEEGVFLVEDALADTRFRDNPLVTGPPHIRFYAGCPLKAAGGEVLGTLCLIAREPRSFSTFDQMALHDLAAWAERELNQIPLAQALASARQAEDRLRALLSALPDDMFRQTGDGTYLDAHLGTPENATVAAQDFLGRRTEDFLPQEAASAWMQSLHRALESGKVQLADYSLLNQSRLRDYEARSVPVSGGEVITIVRDVTERQHAERAKREFISMVSHELRTPLTSIRGSLGLLHGGVLGSLPAKVDELITIAHNNAERLVRMVDQILDMDKVESGKIRFRLGPCALEPLMLQAAESVKSYAQSMEIAVSVEAPPAGAWVEADPDRLIQVLANLLGNAAKHSPKDERVMFRALRSDDGWRIEVGDHGPGVPADLQPSLFQKFTQASALDSGQNSGSGLGLSIAKALVEGMGGTIGFQSQPGSTLFYVEFPEASPEIPDLGPSKPRVLVVEDDPLSARLLEASLSKEGFAVDKAGTAAAALELLSRRRYEAMTLDLVLPDKHGLELLKEIRRNRETQDLRVLVASSITEEGKQRPEVPALQVLEWIQKPLDPFRLAQALACLRTTGSEAGRSSGAKPLVLHVEDDRDVHQVLSALLEDTTEMLHAPTLSAARRILLTRPVDLVILDSHLPDGRGTDLIPDVHAAGGPTLPILLFSGEEPDTLVGMEVSRTLQKSSASNLDIQRVVQSLLGGS